MEITLNAEENKVFESLCEVMSDEIAVAHLMQNIEYEVFVNDSEEEEEDEEEETEDEEVKETEETEIKEAF